MKIKKYKVSKLGIVFLGILCLISLVLYFYFSYNINVETINIAESDVGQIAIMKSVKEVLLVILSICGTNFLLNIWIEIDSKNSTLTDFLCNDIFACPDFYENMNVENKEKIYKALDREMHFDSKNEIFYTIKDKINALIEDYYFESCEYFVECDIKGSYIEKIITKKVIIKSYQDSFTIEDFCVGNVSTKKIQGKDIFELMSVKINGDTIDINSQIVKKMRDVGNLDEHNEYDESRSYVYKNKLKVYKDTVTTIEVKCKTRTTIDDKLSSFRVTKPCKNFMLNYTLKQSEKYRLVVDAYGFLDDADDSTNNSSKSSVNIRFKDWIFKHDGVVVVILDK